VCHLLKNNLNILYSDNGTGIPKVFKKNKDEIFRPFTTSKKDSDGNDIGTGLGMYLAKNVVMDNGGDLEIMDPSIGFTIKITLPIRNK
jgi:signal transduction histidine kinase